MNLPTLVRNLQSRLNKTEKVARRSHAQADALRQRLEGIAAIVGVVGKKATVTTVSSKTSPRTKQRTISKAHRKANAAAQKARWAKLHAAKKAE